MTAVAEAEAERPELNPGIQSLEPSLPSHRIWLETGLRSRSLEWKSGVPMWDVCVLAARPTAHSKHDLLRQYCLK